MSLLNQIIAAVFAVLIGLVSGTIYIMSDSSKSMLLNQLESHSNDTATHLGLYMAPYIAAEDSAGIETIVNAIFDSGYYEKIQVVNYDRDDLFTALRSPEISDEVPNWFVKLIAFNTPNIEIEVTHSWAKVGFIVVKSRAGYAYEELWKGTQTTLIWFITLSLICVVFLSTLIRVILRPLKSIEDQAKALTNKQYIEVTKIPKTKELKSVVITMNSMIKRVQTMFEEQSKNIEDLRKIAYIDDLTGLANSRAIKAQLSDKLDSRDDEGPQTLIYLHINSPKNSDYEQQQKDSSSILKSTSVALQKLGDQYIGSILGRIGDSDLVLLIPQINESVINAEVNTILQKNEEFIKLYQQADDYLAIQLAVIFSTEDTTASEIIATAKNCIIEAEEQQKPSIYQTLSTTTCKETAKEWEDFVVATINAKKVFLQYQNVTQCSTKETVHKELLVRILNQAQEICAAAKFIGIVKDQGLIEDLDKTVVEHAINHIKGHSNESAIAINISVQTLTSDNFKNWLAPLLKGFVFEGKLSIEVNEASLFVNMDSVIERKQWLNNNGIGFGIDNFGINSKGFSYLYKLQPNYIKIDGSLCKEIVNNAEDKFFLSSLVTAANSLSIPSYAERIENPEQIEQLVKLGVNATQGFIHGKPENLKE